MYSLVGLSARISRTGKLLRVAGAASLVAPGELRRFKTMSDNSPIRIVTNHRVYNYAVS